MTDIGSWDLWRSFLSVAEEGSLSGAARVRMQTQPTIGRHIDQLESELGAALFVRSRSGLKPTALAESLLPHARAMAASAHALDRAAQSAGAPAAGVVRITASEVVGIEVLPAALASLRAAHPKIELELTLNNALDDLAQRDADIAVRMVRPTQTRLVARKIGEARIGLYATRRYLEECGAPGSVEALADHHLIGIDRDAARLLNAPLGGRVFTPSDFDFRCDSDLGQLAALRAGLGIGVCQVAVAARDPNLVRVLREEADFGLEVWLTTHQSLRNHHIVRAVFDHLAGALYR